MKKLLLAVAAVIGLAVFADAAQAGGHANPFNVPQGRGPVRSLFGKQPLPAFQAAPWYLYWPYNSHFMTPAPMGGAWYGPAGMGASAGNPYFAAPQAPAPVPVAPAK